MQQENCEFTKHKTVMRTNNTDTAFVIVCDFYFLVLRCPYTKLIIIRTVLTTK